MAFEYATSFNASSMANEHGTVYTLSDMRPNANALGICSVSLGESHKLTR